jgi:4-hydroxy-tetrahydrodipicolinate synthase
MARFGSLITAMITPFDDDGRVDLEGAAALAEWLVAQGNDGLVVTGSTGRRRCSRRRADLLWRACARSTCRSSPGRAPTTPATPASSPRAADHGIDAVLVVTPTTTARRRPGSRPTSVPWPARPTCRAAHDIPIRSGRKISHEVLVRLAHEVPNIVGLNDAAANATKTARTVADTPADFEVDAGDDNWTLPMMAVGAVGIISVAGHWAAPVMSEMIAAFDRGDHTKAWELNALLLESWDFESSELTPNPIPAKAMMRAIGRPAGQCRLPMGPAPAGLEERALEVWNTLHG